MHDHVIRQFQAGLYICCLSKFIAETTSVFSIVCFWLVYKL